MKKMKKVFCIMSCVGMGTFMAMGLAMLFIDFRVIELFIPYAIGCVGTFGEIIIDREMKKRSRKIKVRKKMARRA